MKPILILAASLLTITARAQDNTGTIEYEQTIKMDFSRTPELAAFAEMIPKQMSDKRIMYYTQDVTLYKSEKKPEETTNEINQGNNVRISFDNAMPDEVVYKDLKEGVTYEQKDFMGRQFLVTGDIKQQKWKMTGRQKEILGYPSQEATLQRDKDTIIAWFTPAIPVASGPGSLGNLPGMILEATVSSMIEIKAVSVKPGTVDKALLQKPKGGKKMTEEEFDKLVAEKTKEMQAQYGGGDGKQIIIRREVH